MLRRGDQEIDASVIAAKHIIEEVNSSEQTRKGCTYCSYWDVPDSDRPGYRLFLFTSNYTDSTIALKMEEFTVTNVINHTNESDDKFAPMRNDTYPSIGFLTFLRVLFSHRVTEDRTWTPTKLQLNVWINKVMQQFR